MFREYSPAQGRWVSPDPAGLTAVNLTDPQSWNRYVYATNRPLDRVDPLGLDSWSFVGNCSLHYSSVITTAPDGTIHVDLLLDFVSCDPGPGSGPPTPFDGGGLDPTGTSDAANNGKSAADIARCAAEFSNDHSMAAALDAMTGGAVSKDNLLVNSLLGSDASTISNLITGPRLPEVTPALVGQGVSIGVKVIGNLPNPAATGLASLGTATIRETAGGTAFAAGWTNATVATSLVGRTAGKAFAVFSIGKAVWDASTYAFGAIRCY